MGRPKKSKLDKPPYKPVKPKNTESISSYAERLEYVEESPIVYDFVNIDQDTHYEELFENFHFHHSKFEPKLF